MRPYAGKAGAAGKAEGPPGRPVVTADAVLIDRSALGPVASCSAALERTGRPAPAGATGRLRSLAHARAAGYDLLPGHRPRHAAGRPPRP